jgi:L-alanine-DL-glutamate epimerase-like enolase superfamily enzyme
MRIDQYDVRSETWPLVSPFRISRGAKSEATVVTVSLGSGPYAGRGECCPYPRYGETVEEIEKTLRSIDLNALGCHSLPDMRQCLLHALPPGSARNALDCALWDLEAKANATTVARIAALPDPQPLITCYTLSLDTPEAMADASKRHADCPLLKLKLGDASMDVRRIRSIRNARPDARLVADPNEGWATTDLTSLMSAATEHRLELVEQPLPADQDAALTTMAFRAIDVPICADESASPGILMSALQKRYQAVNIKLDKTGGLTSAIATIRDARRLGLKVMIGSMVSTSLSMAPAALLGSLADWVDLDSPLLLSQDRPFAMQIRNGYLTPPTPELWG